MAVLRKIPGLNGAKLWSVRGPKTNNTFGTPNTCFVATHLIAGLFTAGLDLHVLIVLHRKAVFYNSCIFVDGIGRQVHIPA